MKLEVGPQVRVSDPGAAHAEPHIAAHPRDRNKLIAAAMHFLGEQETLVETYSSNDGGATWSLSHLPRLREALAGKEMIVAGDTWVAYAPDGMVHASIIA